MALALAFSVAPAVAYADEGGSRGFDPLGAIASFFGFGDGDDVETRSENGATVTDPTTIDNWELHLAEEGVLSTQNIGRIWTDKTVADEDISFSKGPLNGKKVEIGDSDFLIGLSALSSTSNLKSTTTITKPLDIVLVLDNSESMDEDAGNGKQKIEVLQEAASSFAQSVAEKSTDTVTNRISIAGLAANGQDEDADIAYQHDFMDCTVGNLSSVQDEIENMGTQGMGHSHSNYAAALSAANDYMDRARSEAVKVVIVFGDGDPTGGLPYPGVSDKNFNWALSQANDLKNAGSTIYSVGVFDGADASAKPSYNGKLNNTFLQYLSSNYPNVTDIEQGGTPAEGESDYYLASENYADLDKLFQDIFEQIVSTVGSGSPIEEETTAGAQNTPGYLTFIDQLGDYMYVTGDTMTLTYADRIFTATSTDDGKTFEFKSEPIDGNDVYESANPADIQITVTKGETLAAGDTVTVKIPASMIPLRNYKVDEDTKKMVVSETFPVRLFYGASLKDDVEDQLANPDDALQSYIDKNTDSKTGLLNFYANKWSGKEDYGDATASFTPSSANRYYYFTSDTPLYLDEEFKTQATKADIEAGKTVYYKDTYYEQDQSGTTAKEVTKAIDLTKDSRELANVKYSTASTAGAYLPAHSPHYAKIESFKRDKTSNATETASTVVNPEWVGGASTTLSAHLGNNGVLPVELPAKLSVTKDVTVSEGFDVAKHKDVEFTFEIAVDGAIDGEYKAEVLTEGQTEAASAEVTFKDGKATCNLKDGQTLTIFGLPADASYTVTEQLTDAQKKAYTSTSEDEKGTLKSGETAEAAFTNEYKAESTKLSDDQIIKVQKTLSGRDWRESDSFEFRIESVAGAPAFDAATATISGKDAEKTKAFGNVTFTKPGEYVYSVYEKTDVDNPITGINYSNEAYEVKVVVTDDGSGQLKVTSVTMTKTRGDGMTEGQPVEVEGLTAGFTNVYNLDDARTTISALKDYTDTSNSNPLANGDFTVKITPVGGYKTAGGSIEDPDIAATDVPMPESAEGTIVDTMTNTDREFRSEYITFDGNDVGYTYVYKLKEESGDEKGMTYDPAEYTVQIAVEEVKDEATGEPAIKATVTPTNEKVTFKNTFDPADATLSGENGIKGFKKLVGRDSKSGESFEFTLKPAAGNTLDGVTGITADGLTTSVTDLEDGVAKEFSFAEKIAFSKAGTYEFELAEKGYADGEGMAYDKHTCKVFVDVSLDPEAGALKAAVRYGGDEGSNTFTNTYTSSLDFGEKGGVKVTKTLTGRTMSEDEFSFAVEGMDDASKGKLVEGEESFSNPEGAANQPVTVKELFKNLTFTQDDAGKTYTYTVKEVQPDEGKGLPAVKYDETVYVVSIAVTDNGDGTMKAVTTVKDSEGSEVSSDTSAGNYTVPTVAFKNAYEPEAAELAEGGMRVQKQVKGAPIDQSFSFTATLTSGNASAVVGLNEDNGVTATTDSSSFYDGASSSASFGALQFKEAGTYTFEVTENTPDPKDGWTWSHAKHTITVTVVDQKDGVYLDKLVASVKGNDSTFTNSYKPAAAELGGDSAIKVTKKVTGGQATDSEFKFELSLKSGVEKWVSGLENGKLTVSTTGGFDGTGTDDQTLSFGTLTFSQAGDYTFAVKEVAPSENGDGWTWDATEREITVKVTDENYGGRLVATVENNNPTITNKYTTTPAELSGETALGGIKTLTGRDQLDSEVFSFVLAQGETADGGSWDSVTMPANLETSPSQALVNGGKTPFTFGDISIAKAGTYTFKVSEKLPEGVTEQDKTLNGVTYDTHIGTITVKVIDNGKGQLVVDEVKSEGTDFTNAYAAEPAFYGVDSTLLGGTKTVVDEANGYAIKDGDFGFYMRAQDAANPLPTGEGVTKADNAGLPAAYAKNTKSNPANDTAAYDFGVIEFNTDDMVNAADNNDGTLTKTFQYNIFEDSGVDVPGISIDPTAYTVTFTVVENQKEGTMTIQSVAAKKMGSLEDPTGGEEVGMDQLNFTNTFDSGKITATANILKILDGRNFAEGEGFTFNVVVTAKEANGQSMAYDDIPKPYEGTGTGSYLGEPVPNDAGDGYSYIVGMHTGSGTETGYTMRSNVGFFDYTRVGTYEFTITEQGKGETKGNLTYSDAEYKVRVVISMDETDPDNPVIKREVWINDQPAFDNPSQPNTLDFTNTYRPGSAVLEGDSALAVQKTLTGRDWTAGDKFNFTLTAVTEGAPMPEGAEGNVANLSVTSENAKAGEAVKAAFGTITFTKDHLGTTGQPVMSKKFFYEIDETNTNGYGLTMDAHVATVTVTVTDDGKGNLSASVAYDNTGASEADAALTDVAAFTNTYAAAPVIDGTGTPAGVTKVLEGRTPGLQNGEFGFTISVEAAEGTPADGFSMPEGAEGTSATAFNDANGAVTFDNITFTKAGTYHVTVKENVPAEADRAPFMTYDEHAYTYDVVVTDDGKGQLKAAVQNEQGDKAFTNTYSAPAPTKTVAKADGSDAAGKIVSVGDELTYTITWANDALDADTGKSVAANVTIKDAMPAGTEFVSASEGGTLDGNTVTWNLGEQAAGAKGSVTLTVCVTDEAAQRDSIENVAGVFVADASPKIAKSPEVYVLEKSAQSDNERPDGSVQVGDVLTYTIDYMNDQDTAAIVTVTDALPESLSVVDGTISNGGVYDEAAHTITWTLDNVASGAKGTVSFQASVNEHALTEGVANQATVDVGDTEVKTNTSTKPAAGAAQVAVSKTVQVNEEQGTQIDTAKAFEFTVALKDNKGNALEDEYALVGANGAEIGAVRDGGTFTLTHGQTATIKDLPEGAQVTVTETAAAGYTAQAAVLETVAGADDQPQSLDFVNNYSATAAGTPNEFEFTKVLEGKDWVAGEDVFAFELTPLTEGAPMPAGTENGVCTATVSKADGQDASGNDTATFGFGDITFAKAGEYEYRVTEVAGDNPGIAYHKDAATVVVTVTDNHNGGLVASADVKGGTFTNTYTSGQVAYDTQVGLQIQVDLIGRAMTDGQFEFTVTPDNDDAKTLFGDNGTALENDAVGLAGEAGNVSTDFVTIPLNHTFTKDDAGKTFEFTVDQVAFEAEGYTDDDTTYKVAIKVADEDGTLTVTTEVNGEIVSTAIATQQGVSEAETVTLPFSNRYDAGTATVGGEGAAEHIAATKTLEGRDQIAGEFTFDVYNAAPAAAERGPVATGTNTADGGVAFSAIEYSTESLNRDVSNGFATRTATEAGDVYTYQYRVVEDETEFDEGVTAVVKSFNFTVEVTDNGKGVLTAKVNQPEMAFVNTYGDGEAKATAIKGEKVLDAADGLSRPDIAGKFSFTLQGEGGAPMPEGSEGAAKTVVNDEFGNVDFGTITYTMDNVFGGEAAEDGAGAVDAEGAGVEGSDTGETAEAMSAERSKIFTYTITESGSVAGVENDTSTKTIKVTVTDNGDGTLDVAKSTAGNVDFTFTNTYKVSPTDPASPTDKDATGGFTVAKTLDGRDLAAGEFSFRLIEDGKVVAEGVNDADGNVALSGITFTEPGTHSYKLAEVASEVDDGVTYDATVYDVGAAVTDNGDGTLSVAWSADGEEIAFTNSYAADPVTYALGATKVLEGGALADGQFTFQMIDRDGKVFREAKNDAEGAVAFPAIEFTQAGTYTYTVVEKNDGQEGVTYDDERYQVIFEVTDNGKGALELQVAKGNLQFTNTYAAPIDPEPVPLPPADAGVGDGTTLVRTGDAAPAAPLVGGVIAALAALAFAGRKLAKAPSRHSR